MKHAYLNITAYVMAVVIAFTGILSLPLSVSAQTTTTLYGTGSEDDIDIVKLLDMALNKGGMSMSPATIKAFLEYWYDSVAADLNTCINNADSAITTTTAFVDYLNSAIVDGDHYDNLGDIIKRYIQYVLTMDYKSLSDFKQLLTQEGTFRKFLLSYVTDEDGNIAGMVDNKLKRYNLKSGFVNMTYQAAKAYIAEYEGYYLVPTFSYKDFLPTYFPSQEQYSYFYRAFQTLGDDDIIYFYLYYRQLTYLSGVNFIGTMSSWNMGTASGVVSYPCFDRVYFYSDDWNAFYPMYATSIDVTTDIIPDLSDETFYKRRSQSNYDGRLFLQPYIDELKNVFVTKDGRYIKVWKSLDAFKSYNVGQSNIYYSNGYPTFDNSVDNSITFSGDYYMNNDYSHTTIQNNIDNSQDINETTVNNIVNNYITNNYYGSDSSGGGGGSGSGSGNWFADLITGIPQLLAALIEGIASLLEAGGKLIEAITDIFTKLFVPSEGFADPIKLKIEQKFSFVEDTHMTLLDVVDRFSEMGQTVPIITFPLSKTPLANYGVGDVTVSFDWFEPYRVGFQLLISAIMWAMFLFNQFFGLKNLIQGTGSFTSTIDGGEPEHNPIGFIW